MSPASYDSDDEWFGPPPENVVIGEHSHLYSTYAFRRCASEREPAIQLGRFTSTYPESCFDLGPDAQITVGDYTTLSDVIISTNGHVEIGSHCMIGWSVVIADVGHATPPASRSAIGDPRSPEIVIGDNVWVGARAVVLGGARIGEGAIVGAAAVVDFEVPPNSIAAGNPARVMGKLKTSS